ncbi:MAG: alpha/beta hydrolase [Candidatus Pacebacteria bacterium]|nr:alpha/beta hydrolase [Candidatus Paceibacterota bacterium]
MHTSTLVRVTLRCCCIFVFVTIIAGYLFTFYKEHLGVYRTPQEIKSLTISDSSQVTYQTWGEKGNQTVVLLHGTGANSFIWKDVAPLLTGQGYYVIAFDIPPFGWSQIPKNQDYRKEIQGERLASALKGLQVHNPIIVGHSFSSKVAIQLGLLIPIKKLLLVAPVLDYTEPTTSPATQLIKVSFIRDPLLSLFINNSLLAERLLYSFMYKKDVDIKEMTKLTTLPFNKPRVNHAYGEWFQEFFIQKSLVSDSLSLQKVDAPIAVLWGDKDTIIGEENFELLKAIKADATKTTLAEVGHMPHLENLKLFTEKLLESLR